MLDKTTMTYSGPNWATLRGLTSASRGLAYFPKAVSAVDEIATQVAHEIRNQYILGYSPSDQSLDGTYRPELDVLAESYHLHPPI
jgi:hypothetical protein